MNFEEDAFLEQIHADWMQPSEYVLIKSEMSTEDDIAIQNGLAVTRGKGKKAEIAMQLGNVKLLTLEKMVKGWNLFRTIQKPDGTTQEIPIPFSVAMIRKLPKKYTTFIYKEIDKRNPDPDEEEEEAFLPDVIDSSEGSLDEERILKTKTLQKLK